MENIYLKIWKLAKPHYKKGRPYDIAHIEWMMKESEKVAEKENFDKKLLMPISILHDVGYSVVEKKNMDKKRQEIKKIHMKEGAKISREILEKVGYQKDYTQKIVHYISVHDNWVFGDNSPFKECKEMAVFNDLDFLWVAKDIDNFERIAKAKKMTPKELYKFLVKNEKLVERPLCCDYTKNIWERFKKKLKKSLRI